MILHVTHRSDVDVMTVVVIHHKNDKAYFTVKVAAVEEGYHTQEAHTQEKNKQQTSKILFIFE